jgi:cytochrome c-type biogenesis protein
VIEVPAALERALATGSVVALPLALAGGLIAGFNPCCLALYPAAAATCCAGHCRDGHELHRPSGRILSSALAFVIGVALATSTLGILAAAAGRVTEGLGRPLRYLVATVPLLMGVHVLGWLPLPLAKLTSKIGRPGIGGALSTGFLLALVIGPCSTPVLASVLSYAAYQGSLLYGGALLFVYGMGAGTPVLLAGTASGTLAERLGAWGGRQWLDRVTGVCLLCLGFYLLWIA